MTHGNVKGAIARSLYSALVVLVASFSVCASAQGDDESIVTFYNMSTHDADVILDAAYSCHSPGYTASDNHSFCMFGNCSPSRPDGMHFCTTMSLPTGRHTLVVKTGTSTLSIEATQYYHPSESDPDLGTFPPEYRLDCNLTYLVDGPHLSCGDKDPLFP
jgi:hypothetical protein